uniref:protein-serine/threonine phosphatase n=1 Tax=Solanum tuberosum TaxID=4113 RepID=M1DLW0_SOLTU
MENKGNVDQNEEGRMHRQYRIQLRRREQAREAQMRVGVLPPPAVGSKSVKGMRPSMEDEVSIHPNLCSPLINGGRPLHFYAVYDGHGGPQVSALCRERMHLIVAEELMRPENNTKMMSSGSSSSSDRRQQRDWEAAWMRILQRSFQRMDKMICFNCDCATLSYRCLCPPNHNLRFMGSTAIIAIVTDHAIVIANCGDSRAVLSRNGNALSVSFDHKPNRRDELARIKAAGGKLVYSRGLRVQGFLAMSRAIGDSYLKPYVISEPEFTFVKRKVNDECLILASDGLWDVVSNETACRMARVCLQGDAIFFSHSETAAALLTRIATGRNSHDNVSVIVVDFTRN